MSIYRSFGSIDDEFDRPRSRHKPIRYQTRRTGNCNAA